MSNRRALTAVSQLQQLSAGQQFHAQVVKNPLAVSVTVLNAVVVMYSRCDLIGEALNVFDKMTERDIVSWNTMVTALVQNGLDEEGLMVVREMQKQGFSVDSVTATALLSVASNLRNIGVGKQTHAYLIRRRIQFEGMDVYLIDMYGKCGLIKKAQLFERTNSKYKDLATWNAMLSGNTQNGLFNEAFTVLGQMLQSNMLPNAVTIASVFPPAVKLVALPSHGMGNIALSLFNSMEEAGVKPDSVTFVAALSACSHSGLVDEGLKIFKSMETEYGIKPSTEHYCCVVDMVGRGGRFEEAFWLAEELGKEGNAIRAWGSLLSSCKIHGQYELAKAVADRLLQLEYESGTSGYHVLFSNIYADEGSWDGVDRVRHEMQQRGLRKDVGCSWIEIAGTVSCFMSKDKNHESCDDICRILGTLAEETMISAFNSSSFAEISQSE